MNNITILFMLLCLCFIAAFALVIWYVIRCIGLLDDVRFLSDVARSQHPEAPYRQTSGAVIVGIIVLPIAITLLSAALTIASSSIFLSQMM